MDNLPGTILIIAGVIILLTKNGIISIQNRLMGLNADTFSNQKRKIILTILGILLILFGVMRLV